MTEAIGTRVQIDATTLFYNAIIFHVYIFIFKTLVNLNNPTFTGHPSLSNFIALQFSRS